MDYRNKNGFQTAAELLSRSSPEVPASLRAVKQLLERFPWLKMRNAVLGHGAELLKVLRGPLVPGEQTLTCLSFPLSLRRQINESGHSPQEISVSGSSQNTRFLPLIGFRLKESSSNLPVPKAPTPGFGERPFNLLNSCCCLTVISKSKQHRRNRLITYKNPFSWKTSKVSNSAAILLV